jgi:lysophospholipase L1-like esterase
MPLPEGLPLGFPSLLWALPGLVAVLAAPYLVRLVAPPPAEDGAEVAEADTLTDATDVATKLCAWLPGDPLPFSNHFRTDRAGPKLMAAEQQALQETAPLDEGALAAAPSPVVLLKPPPPSTVGQELAPSAPPVAAVAPHPYTRIQIPKELTDGVTVRVEDPHGAMQPFYDKLARTALGQPGAITRVAHFGDSAIAADGMTSTSRRLFQAHFGDAGHGFILIEPGSPYYVHKDIKHARDGWSSLKFIGNEAPDGRYGYGGVVSRGYQGAQATYETVDDSPVGGAFGKLEVYHQVGKGHGRFEIQIDAGAPVTVDTSAEATGDRVERVTMPDGPHRIGLRATGGGQVALYGVAFERDRPGVVYDNLGQVGARAARWLNVNDVHFSSQLAQRKPDLLILMYGGNELPDRTTVATYKAKLTEVVHRFRNALPDTSCLLMSPLDHGERYRGRVRTVPRLLEMIPAQREVAFAEGCAYYSVFDAMGGEGAMGRWVGMEPALGSGDFAHPTNHGSRVLGSLFFKSVMRGLAEFLAEPLKAQ